MATYVGYETMGFLGGIVATLGLVTPSVIVICIIAKALKQFHDSPIVQGIFRGLRPAVVGFIISAVITIFLNALFNINLFQTTGVLMDLFQWKAIALFLALTAFAFWKPKLHPIVLISMAALAGILLQF